MSTETKTSDYETVVRGLTKISDDSDIDGWWESGEFLVNITDHESGEHTVVVMRGTALIGTFHVKGSRFIDKLRTIIKRSLASRPL